MSTRVITGAQVRELLPMGECIEVMSDVFRALGRGDVVQPLRSMMWKPDRSGLLGVMPGWLGSPAALGIKVVTVTPGNHGTPFDAHQGAVLLFEAEHGSLIAIVDASSVTAIRTAAVSGLATRLLAREDAGDLALLGAGVQASTHLDAMRAARPIRRVRVWSRSPANAEAFAAREARRIALPIEAVSSARAAVAGADLICTTTAAREPVLEGAWIAPGAHVNAVGACFPTARELDTAAVRRALLFVDRRESALAEAGDFLIPRQEGAIGDDHIRGEIGELVLGQVAGRADRDDVTLFKSLGLAVEDVAAVHHIHRRAVEREVGTEIDLGGRRAT